MKDIATVKFLDKETGEETLAIVRADKDKIALSLSLMSNGDIEVMMGRVEARDLVTALQTGIEVVG